MLRMMGGTPGQLTGPLRARPPRPRHPPRLVRCLSRGLPQRGAGRDVVVEVRGRVLVGQQRRRVHPLQRHRQVATPSRPAPAAGATRDLAAGLAPADTGAVTPASGSSVRGVVRVSASPTSGAAASRAVSAGSSQRVSMVLSTDVWSSGMSPGGTRNTVPAAISGETSTAGTRTPNRVKSKPYSPTRGVRRGGARGRRHVVVAAAVLVVGDDQQRLVPGRAVAQRLVDVAG